MKTIYILLLVPIFIFSCTNGQKKITTPLITIEKAFLDSIIKITDTSYSKPYKRGAFYTAVYYLNKKDSSVCQIMKDSVGTIRQIIIAKKDIRTFFSQYYTNGQLQAELPLDEFGQYHGVAIFYYQDGLVQSNGDYVHGLKTGQWKNFNEKGKLISTDNYDKNGQLIR